MACFVESIVAAGVLSVVKRNILKQEKANENIQNIPTKFLGVEN